MNKNFQKTLFAQIIENKQLRENSPNYILSLKTPKKLLVYPGQFFMIYPSEIKEIKGTYKPQNHLHYDYVEPTLLGRPLSLADLEYNNDTTIMSFIYKIVGKGTTKLAKLSPGGEIKIVGPLGKNYFRLPPDLKNLFLIAGGIGLPPLLFLAKQALKIPSLEKIYFFIGSANQAEIPLPQNIENSNIFSHLNHPSIKLLLATDDGSEGTKGFITDLFAHKISEANLTNSLICTCGPKIMMKKIAELAENLKIPTQVAMEERMACGVGLCQSCAIPIKSTSTTENYKLCCTDGPVFTSQEINWDI